jgi:PAT family beta-lactamase induction signal transducer AmpG
MAQNQLLTIFLFGFSSGLPFLLILSTFNIWLTEAGVSKTAIGIFTWVTISYTCKFILSPFVDNCKIPVLCQYLGQRRSWLLFAQIALILSLILLGHTRPSVNIWMTAIAAFMVGFFSAIQDIVIEAYRIEIVDSSKLGLGSSLSVLGYRLGMLISGAGAIYIAAYFNSWTVSYNVMACCMVVGVLTTLLAKEPNTFSACATYHPSKSALSKTRFFNIVIAPFKSFVVNTQWQIIIVFIICYKFADTVLNVMSMPFLIEIGFSKIEIANVAKTFGIITMICGGIIGGIFLKYCGLWRLLFFSVVLQFFAGGLFVNQAYIGHNVGWLFVTMGIENFTCGLAQIALMSYFSMLCRYSYTAVYYAILSSFASFTRINFSMLAGWLADRLMWEKFYLIVCFSCILTLIMLQCCTKHFSKHQEGVSL